MKIFITGATGFIGFHLAGFLLESGHEVTAAGRAAQGGRIDHPSYHYLRAETTRPGAWQDVIPAMDAVINLAGKSIFGRWTKRIRREIYDSRILTTRHVVAALPESNGTVLCSASGIGYYGNRGEDVLAESEPAGADFLAALAVDWESEAMRAAAKGSRVVPMRFGVVLSQAGGALEKMMQQFKSFVGGAVGNGRQWVSWMHLQDLMAGVQFVLTSPAVRGPVNFCAPEPVRNQDFARTLGRALGRPAVVSTPSFMIRMLLGEFGRVLLDSQRALPEKLLQHGFQFQFPRLTDALQDIVSAPSA